MVKIIELVLLKTKKLYWILFLIIPFINLNAQMKSEKVYMLNADEFYIKLNSTPDKLILDVRELKDFKKERIQNAVSASSQQILLTITDTLDHEIPLFIYCDVITRSIEASELLKKKEFVRMYILEEGIIGWKKKKLPVDKKRIPGRN